MSIDKTSRRQRLRDNMFACSMLREYGYIGAAIDNATGTINLCKGEYTIMLFWENYAYDIMVTKTKGDNEERVHSIIGVDLRNVCKEVDNIHKKWIK